MLLELLCYSDKVTVLNPEGSVAILTLWSKVDTVMKKFQEGGREFPPCVAAISNYYGDGINQLLVNLLNNPQITRILILGNNRTDSPTELLHYFGRGVEQVKINGSLQYRVKDTTRLINEALADNSLFDGRRPEVGCFCFEANGVQPPLDKQIETLRNVLALPSPPCPNVERRQVTLIEPKIEVCPSIQAGHQIVSDNPLDAWGELLFCIQRFGLPTKLAKGDRKELLNLKVVITDPKWQEEAQYQKYNLSKDGLERYCRMMMQPDLDADTSYTYGNRLQQYFEYDMIEKTVQRLKEDQEDRKCYLSLWDPARDMDDHNQDGSKRGHPCWVGGFFRVYDGKLTLSVTFRTHRAYTAWIENVHGLINLQKTVAERTGLPVGPLTVISHSISIDPGQLPLVESIVQSRKWRLRDDGRGEVVFDLKDGKAIVEHKMSGVVIKRYETANIEALGHHLAQDMLVSDLNHMIYIGRQLGRLQMCLKHGLKYEEA